MGLVPLKSHLGLTENVQATSQKKATLVKKGIAYKPLNLISDFVGELNFICVEPHVSYLY